MKRKCRILFFNQDTGFSLLEITVVLIIISLLLSAAIPVMSRIYLERAAQKTAMEIQNIEDAALGFYLNHAGTWPSSINTQPNDLESANYLPTWNPVNPFGNSYTINPGPPPSQYVTITTTVTDGAQNIITSLLPLCTSSGTALTCTVTAPGGPMSPVKVFTGTIGDGGTIPLPTGYIDSQCQWFIASSTAETYDSSGKDGCENDQYIETHITNRVVSAYTHGDCRRSYVSNSVNYVGICTNS